MELDRFERITLVARLVARVATASARLARYRYDQRGRRRWERELRTASRALMRRCFEKDKQWAMREVEEALKIDSFSYRGVE